jgi:flagellar L-ring protein precursor FlgH
MRFAFLALSFPALLGACMQQHVQNLASADFEPIYPQPQMATQNLMPTGSIYSDGKSGLFATDRRATRVGDILTVAFTERFQATKSQNAASTKTSDSSINLPDLLPIIPAGESKLGMGTNQSFSGTGSAAQSNSLSGRMSVSVVRILPGGNLEILGQKKLTLNNGDEYIRVHGIVRPEDISSGNVVMSDRIANADIKYIGAGDVADSGKKGWLARGFEALSPL